MSARSNGSSRPQIVDAHVHLFDSTSNVHPFLNQTDATFEALIGDYSALPRRYLLDDYRSDCRSCDVRGAVCHEFLSLDPVREARWMEDRADASSIPLAVVALVDFLDPHLDERLEAYRSLPGVTAVREHLGWDTANPLRRFAKRGDLLGNHAWRRAVAQLASYDFRCGLEVFAPQLPQLLPVIRENPQTGFTIAVLGWPLDLSPPGFREWRRAMGMLSECENVCASVAAVECVFGMGWSAEQIRPWLLTVIDLFGPSRCMLGSHMPIAGLSRGFDHLYRTYREIIADFSTDEQDQMLRSVAAGWFRL